MIALRSRFKNALRFLSRKILYLKLLEIIEKCCVSTIVDIGCDTGHFILIAEKYFDRKQGKSMKLIGVDIDREVLRKAKIASEYSLFINADMFLLPLRDNSVDCVFFSHVIEHIVDPRPVLGEFKRILRRGMSSRYNTNIS